MAGYVIANVNVTDPTLFEEYRGMVPGTIEAYGGKYLVRGGAADVAEGTWTSNRLVVIEFDSVDRAKEWYNSPEYSAAKAVRQRASTGDLLFVEGIE
jgi:uncharacterized protein (DUF1330 family)